MRTKDHFFHRNRESRISKGNNEIVKIKRMMLLLWASVICWSATFVVGLAATSSKFGPLNTKVSEHLPLARKLMTYLDKSTDPFHAVEASIERLKEVNYVELDEREPFVVQPGGKYYFTRNKSTLVAFQVGDKYGSSPGVGGFKIIGGHTDSPVLKVKPRSKRQPKSGCHQLGVETYGGGLWYTWFDRDLGVCGRVMVRSKDGKIEQRLLKIQRPILRVPTLAIHLETEEERKAFKVNKEDHTSPILAMHVEKALSSPVVVGEKAKEEKETDEADKKNEPKDGWTEHQEPLLLHLIAQELDISIPDIIDFELNLFDVQTASLGGAFNEFLHSARLDNLASCFLATEALAEYSMMEITDDADISLIALFDHEEVGSSSAVGAGSTVMAEAVERITTALQPNTNPDIMQATLRKSFCLSVDQAHAVHPNYASKHETAHSPKMNHGMVIKRNSNQRYATNGITGLIIREIARLSDLPIPQEFVVRNDCPCGSTIGPIISAATGIRSIDMGCPQWSMHSIRETMGICDVTNGLALFKAFLKDFREVDDALEQ
mmetsp:Transcript_3175/g.4818  ORF Transcript_3175/g.4818 Transcript_3175/m.4818 type:complete len:548 (-) Transcript_3175:180-1823(-)